MCILHQTVSTLQTFPTLAGVARFYMFKKMITMQAVTVCVVDELSQKWDHDSFHNS